MEKHGLSRAKLALHCGLEFIYAATEMTVEFGC